MLRRIALSRPYSYSSQQHGLPCGYNLRGTEVNKSEHFAAFEALWKLARLHLFSHRFDNWQIFRRRCCDCFSYFILHVTSSNMEYRSFLVFIGVAAKYCKRLADEHGKTDQTDSVTDKFDERIRVRLMPLTSTLDCVGPRAMKFAELICLLTKLRTKLTFIWEEDAWIPFRFSTACGFWMHYNKKTVSVDISVVWSVYKS